MSPALGNGPLSMSAALTIELSADLILFQPKGSVLSVACLLPVLSLRAVVSVVDVSEADDDGLGIDSLFSSNLKLIVDRFFEMDLHLFFVCQLLWSDRYFFDFFHVSFSIELVP